VEGSCAAVPSPSASAMIKCGPNGVPPPAKGLFMQQGVQAVCCSYHAAQKQAKPSEAFACWTLAKITPVSRHSALYHFTSTDSNRGTPYTRGRGRTMWHKTWHTTLRAATAEGEVEQDYTPISTWMEWDNGECNILINVHSSEAAAWLHTQPVGSDVWLCKPKRMLSVPALVPDVSQYSIQKQQSLEHKAVLLVLGGTGGIPVAEQVLQHTDPSTCFGTGVDRTVPLLSPVHVVYACDHDDVFLTRTLARWCVADGATPARLQRLVLAISAPQQHRAAAFPQQDEEATEASQLGLKELETLDGVSVLQAESLTSELLQAEMAPLLALGRCRVVVAGGASFNMAVAEMLEVRCQVNPDAITILEA